MKNTLTIKKDAKDKSTRVGDIAKGTIVQFKESYFIVLINKDNRSGIAAVALDDGDWLSSDAMVDIVPAGTVFEITVEGQSG